jgi:cell division protein FtsL
MPRREDSSPPCWRNRPLTRERDTRLARWLWGMLLAVVVALAPAAIYLASQNECLKAAYELNELEVERERLIEEERRLRVERAELESPTRIEAWARREPGLTQPDPEQVFVVRSAAGEPDDLVARASGGAGRNDALRAPGGR